MALLAEDLRAGTLHRPALGGGDIMEEAKTLVLNHTRKLGCRSLNILHCSAALNLSAAAFVTTDERQRRLASSIGLACPRV